MNPSRAAVLSALFISLCALISAREVVGEPAVEAARIVAAGNNQGAAACSSCHGQTGAGLPAAGFPRLASLDAVYLKNQLLRFRAGERPHRTMQAMARALEEEEIEGLARYFAAQPLPPPSQESADPDLIARGRSLALYGRSEEGLAACVSCHGHQGQGMAPLFPPLVGQSSLYLRGQLDQWRTGRRRGDPGAMMAIVATRMRPEDVDAVVAYFASLPVAPLQLTTR
jgi:cytochrome c553